MGTVQVNLVLPCKQSREPQRADGASSNTPPTSSRLSPTVWTRETSGRMPRQVEVGRREPYEMPMPSWGVGWGIIVWAQESWVHQDEDWRRRPLAWGSTEYKGKWRTQYPANAQAVPSLSGEGMLVKWDQTQMNVCECRRNGNRGSILYVEKDLRCCAGCGESRTSGAKRGAWGNVPQGNAPCAYPTTRERWSNAAHMHQLPNEPVP